MAEGEGFELSPSIGRVREIRATGKLPPRVTLLVHSVLAYLSRMLPAIAFLMASSAMLAFMRQLSPACKH